MSDSRSRRDFLRLVTTTATVAGATTQLLARDRPDEKGTAPVLTPQPAKKA